MPLLEESGLAAGRDFYAGLLARARRPGPHRLHAAQHAEGRRRPDRRVPASAPSSSTARSATRSCAVSTPEAAELTKLLENIFRSVNIALVNELAMLCDRMGIDIWEVVDAAATKPYGFMRFEPGPGHGRPLPAGRPVLPRLARARVRHADRVHRARRRGQPARCRTSASSGSRGRSTTTRKPVQRLARSAILGVSYKPGVGDLRESPALKIMRLLRERGADLVYHDDFVPELPELRAALASGSRTPTAR